MGTLAALNWIEGRRETGPSTRERRKSDDAAVAQELVVARAYAEGEERDPGGMHLLFHDGVWALLDWWTQERDAPTRLSVMVPELDYD